MAKHWVKSTGLWTARVVLSLVVLFALMVGFGTGASDAEKMRLFAEAVERWQHNPDFRAAQTEYVEMGSDAMRTKLAFFDSTKVIMFLRSLPGLPEHLKVNDTSFVHYQNFTRGPLSAYLHLTAEQGMTETLKMLNYLGQKENLNDGDVRGFLREFKLHNPVVADAGAVASVYALVNDVDAGRKFEIGGGVAARLAPHIAAVAQGMGYPADPKQMTPAQQREVWGVLDDEVRAADYELWRSKQVNDWLNGVWAQVYGTMYSGIIGPVLTIREVCRVTGPVLLMGWIGLGMWKRKRAAELAEATGTVGPRLALEGGEAGGGADRG